MHVVFSGIYFRLFTLFIHIFLYIYMRFFGRGKGTSIPAVQHEPVTQKGMIPLLLIRGTQGAPSIASLLLVGSIKQVFQNEYCSDACRF
jgi:hypothetical protein